jgi:probable rRNA maturation factor
MALRFEADILVDDPAWDQALPDAEALAARVLESAAQAENAEGGVSVLLTKDGPIQTLNKVWRGQDKPTNVLSWPAPAMGNAGFLGDIALALETLEAEAKAADKSLEAHVAHLLVHGFLHLRGYDHQNEADAEKMEGRERAILAELGYADPYATRA